MTERPRSEQITVVENKPVIVSFNGGTGSKITQRALYETGKVEYVHAVTTPFDNGGATGRRRHAARGGEIAHADSMKTLLSLMTANGNPEAKDVMDEWFLERHDVTDAVLGQEIMEQLFTPEGAYERVERDLRRMGVHVRGTVLPASTIPSDIAFVTENGRRFLGEKYLDDQSRDDDPVEKMWLDPSVPAYPRALDAVNNADVMILSTGSLHGSILANFLPEGMKESMEASAAREVPLYMITPMTSALNETDGFTPIDFANKVEEYAGRRPTGLIVPSVTRRKFEQDNPRAAKLYRAQHSRFLGWEDPVLEDAQKDGIEIFTHNALVLDHKDGAESVRHDPVKLSEVFVNLVPKQ